MWIDINTKLPEFKTFKDGDLINHRYEQIRKMHYSYNEDFKALEEFDDPYGLMIYEESEPVLVKYKCYFLQDEDKFRIAIGVAVKYQFAPTLVNKYYNDDCNEAKMGIKIQQFEIKTGFILYTSEFKESSLALINKSDIKDEEIQVFEWMNLPKIN